MVSFGGKGGGGNQFPQNMVDIYRLTNMQEGALNRALDRTAAFNLFDVETPFGQQTFEGTPGQPDFRQIISLPSSAQDLMQQGQQLASTQFGQFQPAFAAPIGGQDLGESAQSVEQATFQRGQNLLQPEFDRQMSRLENSLIQRGIPRDSDAWRTEMDELSRRQGAQLENLALSSVAAGRGEQSRLIGSDIARRQQMANELGLFGFGGLVRGPQFQATPQFQAGSADVMGPVSLLSQNMNLDNERRRQERAAGLGGLFDIGSAVIAGTNFAF